MTETEVEDLIRETLARLPDWVTEALQNVEIVVADYADPSMHPDGSDLLGLYAGVPLPLRDSDYAGELPDVIYIFREAHLDLGLTGDTLRSEIETTLIHEVAHYFGIDDDHLDEIGWG